MALDNNGFVNIDKELLIKATKFYIKKLDHIQDQLVKTNYMQDAYKWLGAFELHQGEYVQISMNHTLINYVIEVQKQVPQKII
jgi:hypothetical protein